jgi:hypothetical protein
MVLAVAKQAVIANPEMPAPEQLASSSLQLVVAGIAVGARIAGVDAVARAVAKIFPVAENAVVAGGGIRRETVVLVLVADAFAQAVIQAWIALMDALTRIVAQVDTVAEKTVVARGAFVERPGVGRLFHVAKETGIIETVCPSL